MQLHQPLQIIRQVCPPGRLSTAVSHLGTLIGMPEVVDTGQQRGTEGLAISADTPHRKAAEIASMISTFTAYQARPPPLPLGPVVRQRYLQRRINRLRPRVGEEDPVQIARSQNAQLLRQGNRLVIGSLETQRIIQRSHLRLNRSNDARMTVPQTRSPQPRETIEQFITRTGLVVVTASCSNNPGRLPERPVGGIGKPESMRRIHSRSLSSRNR